jgi:hypothetical protein
MPFGQLRRILRHSRKDASQCVPSGHLSIAKCTIRDPSSQNDSLNRRNGTDLRSVDGGGKLPGTPRHVAMRRARWLKRVFAIAIDTGVRCGGALEVIAGIGQPAVIARLLAHRERDSADPYQVELPPGARAPPGQSSLL